jgi:hypothetical protein
MTGGSGRSCMLARHEEQRSPGRWLPAEHGSDTMLGVMQPLHRDGPVPTPQPEAGEDGSDREIRGLTRGSADLTLLRHGPICPSLHPAQPLMQGQRKYHPVSSRMASADNCGHPAGVPAAYFCNR